MPTRHARVLKELEIMSANTETHFYVKGMKCDGCIAKARGALEQVPGYESSEFDLKAGTASVKGDIDPQAAAQAMAGVGYPAVVKSD
jgi:copper chaperone